MVVGREREQAMLAAALDRAASGTPALVLVTGEAGIGKTTIVDAFARIAHGRGYRVVRGSADERETAGLALWTGPIAALGLGADAVGQTAQRQEGRWEAVDVIAGALEAAAPIVVVLEDLHWADEVSLWVLGQLVGSLAGDILLVATSRAAAVNHLRPGHTVAVGGLSTDEVATMIADHGSVDNVDAAQLHQRSGGNPLFVGELLAHRSIDSRMPPAIGGVLRVTLSSLSALAVRVVATLAIAEPDTPYPVIADALGIDAIELRSRFDEAVAAHVLIETSSVRVNLRHALFGDAALELIDSNERRRLHLALADAWQRGGPETDAPARAAGHALRAVPFADAATAAAAARAAADRRSEAGDLTGAAQLLTLAIETVELYAAADVELRVQLLMNLGDTRSALGDSSGAAAAFDDAIALHPADPMVHARAVLGATRKMPMFFPDPHRRAQIEAAERALPAGDNASRAALLGRIAVAESTERRTWETSRRWATAAVAMARRLGDDALLAEMLIDLHLGVHDRGDLEARAAAAAEVIALGESARRSDLVLVGLEWRYAGAMMHAEIDDAIAAVDEMATIAALMPSPQWRYGVLLRRAMIAAIEGDRQRALRLIDEATPIGRRVLFAQEALGMETGCRVLTSRLSGIADPKVATLIDEIPAMGGFPPVAFFEVHTAASEVVAGRTDAARATVTKWAQACADPGEIMEVPGIEVLLGALVADFGLTESAGVMHERILPYARCFSVEVGFAADLPVDLTLMRLALLAGDVAVAAGHRDDAVRIATSMRSAVLEAHVRWHGADVLESVGAHAEAADERRRALSLARGVGVVVATADADHATTRSAPIVSPTRLARLQRCGPVWQIESPYGDGEVGNTVAIGQLAHLLAAAPADVAAVELAGMTTIAPAGDLGPALDPRAKRAYRGRIEELRAEIDEADEFADIERAAKARLELDALMSELRRAVGLHGRDRPNNEGAERARINVARSLRRAIDAVRVVVPGLGAHFDVSVRTGRMCSYAPEPSAAIAWLVDRQTAVT